MATRSEYPAGTFCWIDLSTTDQPAARAFYGELLGWSFLEVPMDSDSGSGAGSGSGSTYSLATVDAMQVAAIRTHPPERAGTPPHWLSYVSVASADDTAKRALDLGGTVLMEPFDVMTAGRMTVIQDPAGAVVSAWQAQDHFGAALVNQHGTLCWNELMTGDTTASSAFYTGLFGWTTEPFGDTYTVFMNGARPAGGMMQIEEQMGPVAPDWSVYFYVEDCDAIHDQAVALGGAVQMPPMDYPEVGRGCVLADPQGGTFAVIKLLSPPD